MKNYLFVIFALIFVFGCSDEGDWGPCNGYKSEPFFELLCNIDSFKVVHANSSNVRDTVHSSGFRNVLLPIDMNDSLMVYDIYRNDSFKGKVTLNYELNFIYDKKRQCHEFKLDFERIKAKVASVTMDTTIYLSQWGGEMTLEVEF